MLKFRQFIIETAGKGSDQAHRGKISEEQFAHTFNKYSEGREAHKNAHPHASWHDLHHAGMANAKENGQLNSETTEHKESHKGLGSDEAHRTQWDTHHGALSVLHDMHHTHGRHPIGKTKVVAGDTSGETAAREMRGGRGHKEDAADVISHFATHAAHKDGKPAGVTGFSLKYTKTGAKDTKVSQPSSSRLTDYSKVKNDHTAETSKEEKQRTTKLTAATEDQHKWLHGHKTIGKYFDKKKQSNDNFKATRYASEASDESKSESSRKSSKAKIKKHLTKHGVPPEKHDKAISDLADAHSDFTAERTKPHKQQARATGAAIKSKLEKEPHDFVRKLTQTGEQRAGESSPIITIGRHSGSKKDVNDHKEHGVAGRAPTVKSLHIAKALRSMSRATDTDRENVPMHKRYHVKSKEKGGVGNVITDHKGRGVATISGDANKPVTKAGDSSVVVSLPGGKDSVWAKHTRSLKHPDHS